MSEPQPSPELASGGAGDRASIISSSSVSPTPIFSGEQASPQDNQPPAKASILKRIWATIGINGFVVMIMVKPAIAATISMAIYQKYSVAANYLNFGYLIIIVSVLTVPILPRGKFLMNLFFCCLMTCLAVAMIVLGQWAGIKARQHTTPVGASPAVAQGYNSSASAINAIFLLFNVFIINSIRAARPALTIPTIQYTVVVLVGFTYGPSETTVYRSHRFVKEVLYAFLTGQAISTGVSLLIIPVSSRKVFFGEVVGFLQSCRGLLKKQMQFIESLEHSKFSRPIVTKQALGSEQSVVDSTLHEEKRAALKTATAALLVLGSKLDEDVTFAKRETAYGHLDGKNVHALNLILRGIMIPISGLSTIADISVRMDGWRRAKSYNPKVCDQLSAEDLELEHLEWLELVEGARLAFENMTRILDESISHVLKTLKLIPGKSTRKDVAGDVEKGQKVKPISDFADSLERKIEAFRDQRSTDLRAWAQKRGLKSVFQCASSKRHEAPAHEAIDPAVASRETLASARLHIILYMEYLLYSVSKAILVAVRFADSMENNGTMSKKRFIFPTVKTVTKWLKSLLNGTEASTELDPASEAQSILLGNSFQSPRDPEHLAPKNFGQRLGNHFRLIPRFFGSSSVKFGARTAIAVFSIGIMAYLKNTHAFFIRQRLVWSLVMISIGMNPTAGSAVFNLFGNLTFTLFGMIGAFINWYIVDQKTAGVIVMFFVFMCFYFYWAAKYPRFLTAIVAGALTHVLIVGYELQVRVIGVKQSTATGQSYYEFYELAPYRLLIVGGGVLVGYIWTIFPVPITEASVLRRDLGGSLYVLAKYLSCVTATVDQKLLEADEGSEIVSDHGKKLDKARAKLLAQLITGINGMKANLSFMTFEPRFGGSFPSQIYKDLLNEVQSITYYLTIIAYASTSFHSSSNSTTTPGSPTWLHNFTLQHRQTLTSSKALASLFSLLSASIKNAQALPPYLHVPEVLTLSHARTPIHPQKEPSHGISNESNRNENSLLGLENVNEDGYRAVVVIEVAQRAVAHSVERIVELVKELCGQLDFGYSVVAQGDDESV